MKISRTIRTNKIIFSIPIIIDYILSLFVGVIQENTIVGVGK